MTMARDAIALPETFDLPGQTLRWGHFGTARLALMRVGIG